MKENDNKFSVSTIMERLKNSQRLISFLILVMGTIFPIAIILIDSISFSYLPFSLHQYLGAMLFVSALLGWTIRYVFILYDFITKNIRIKLFAIFFAILLMAVVLTVIFGLHEHSLNIHLADENYSLEVMFLNLMVALHIFPLLAFFSRKTNVKKETLCLTLTVALSLLGSLFVFFCF